MDRKSVAETAEYVYREFGIQVQESRRYSLEAKLERLVHREGYGGMAEFLALLRSGDAEAREKLARYITTGHTYFFREKDHFDFLAGAVREGKAAEPMIWCAACSTGEEAYSIAISLFESGSFRFRIVASDLNPAALSAFSRGVYDADCFRATPPHIKRRYFAKAGKEGFSPMPELRERISIKRLNIMDDFVFPRPFDYVFCRNMLIYFDRESRSRAVSRLLANLAPGGLLFLGHTEAFLDPPEGLDKVMNAAYRYAGPAGRAA